MKYIYSGLLIICVSICQATFAMQIVNDVNNDSHLYTDNDSIAPKQVIIKFLKWYKLNLNKANSFPILIKDSANNFMINKSACARYLSLLKSSGCLSSTYIAYWKSFFDDQAVGLRNNPIQSDIPEYFDLDFILITQEPELVLDHINEMKFKTIFIRKNEANIAFIGPQKDAVQYMYEMHKTATGWQIDYISTPGND